MRTFSIIFCLIFSPLILAKVTFTLENSFEKSALSSIDFSRINYASLCEVADKTLHYMNTYPEDDFAVHSGKEVFGMTTLSKVKATLTFVCDVYREDIALKQNSRLKDVKFLKQYFNFYRWLPDKKSADIIAQKSTNVRKSEMLNAIPKDKIFLTKYYTKLLQGSEIKTAKFTQALYGLPFDESNMTLKQAALNSHYLTRYRYTRQQILTGILSEKKLAKPLVWITEEALHDVLLQGTGVLKVNGTLRYFNVHRNNNIAYDYAIGKREQARYWYFSEVPAVMGYGKDLASKIAINPHVSFAGNVKQLGLGKLFLVSGNKQSNFTTLGVLADQGGAFDNNLFQLDLLVDSYQGWSDYHTANKNLPDYTSAWLMLKK